MQRIKLLLLPLALLLSMASHAAPDGARLFEFNCSACHGLNGEGGVGVPLALNDFLNSIDDDYLFKTIRHGRPGRVMPAFEDLSDAQVEAIVKYVRSWEKEKAGRLEASTAPVHGNAGRGKALFARHCAQCHGTNGEGGHGTGVTFSRPRDLPIIPPALNNTGFLSSASDQMIKYTVSHGREGTPMPSFAKAGLSEKEIDDIVSYVRSFAEAPIRWEGALNVPPVLVLESSYSLEETVENVKRSASGENFRIIRIQNVESGLFPDEEVNQKQVIIYFCNFSFINKALALDPRIGMFMPCRVTVTEVDGVVQVMSINPKYMGGVFNNAELDEACQQMYDLYTSILEEATL